MGVQRDLRQCWLKAREKCGHSPNATETEAAALKRKLAFGQSCAFMLQLIFFNVKT